MPQTPERKKSYAKEYVARNVLLLREKHAKWRADHPDYGKTKARERRLRSRAMCLVAAARVRARAKGINFSISGDEVYRLQAIIDVGVCELSGVRLTLEGSRSATSPSLDRIVPSRGYTDGNLRIVCHALNAGMGDWGQDELYRIAQAWMNQATR